MKEKFKVNVMAKMLSQSGPVAAVCKCVITILAWNSLWFILPTILNDKQKITKLLTCDNEFDVFRICVYAFNHWFIIGLFFMFVDHYNETKNELHTKRIVYPKRKGLMKVNWEKVNISIHLSMTNTITSLFGLMFIFVPLAKWRGVCDEDNINNYNLFWALLKLPFVFILTDIIFYVTHRFFHEMNWFYVNIHKIHHQFIDTYAITSNACHPVEHIMTNMGCVFLPGIILNWPLYCSAIWCWMATVNGLMSHSGYVYFSRTSGIPHDFHHHFQNVSYGAGRIMDRLFRTQLQNFYPKKYSFIMHPYKHT